MHNRNWFALAVRPHKERYVERQLQSKGHRVVCPRYAKTIRHARRQRVVEAPIFPGYLFVQLTAVAQNWREVNWTPGAMGFVKFCNSPSALNSEFVDDFILRAKTNGVVEFHLKLEQGDRVQALGGPFDGFVGEVINMSEQDRVKVLMNALNRKVEMTLPRKAVIAAA